MYIKERERQVSLARRPSVDIERVDFNILRIKNEKEEEEDGGGGGGAKGAVVYSKYKPGECFDLHVSTATRAHDSTGRGTHTV